MRVSLLLVAAWAAHATYQEKLLAQRSLELLAQWQEEWRSTAETEARQAVESGQANSAQEMDAKPTRYAFIFSTRVTIEWVPGLGMRGFRVGLGSATPGPMLRPNCPSLERRKPEADQEPISSGSV